MEEYEYSGQYTYDDYLYASRTSWNSQSVRWVVYVLFFLFLLWSVLMVLADVRRWGDWLFIVLSLIFLAFPYTLLPIVVRGQWRKAVVLHHPVKIVLAGNRILFTTSTYDKTIRWLDHHVVTDQMVLLYDGPYSVVMLPRRFAKRITDYYFVKEFLTVFPVGRAGLEKLVVAEAETNRVKTIAKWNEPSQPGKLD